ncbi:MAG: hypothetical protein HY897_20880 [Deltaproteobacteria bacterium]|nr:hypothetical protein [Deltaproteobacteria bacterium]
MKRFGILAACSISFCLACGGGDLSGGDTSGAADSGETADKGSDHDAGRVVDCEAWRDGQAAELSALADGFKTCKADTDCSAVKTGTECLGGWTTAIRADKTADFEKAKDAIADKWCVQPYLNGCEYRPESGLSKGRLYCANGGCEMDDIPLQPDGGTDDGGPVTGDSGETDGSGAADTGQGLDASDPSDASDVSLPPDAGLHDAGVDAGTQPAKGTADDPLSLCGSPVDSPLPLPFSCTDARDTKNAVSDEFDTYPPNTVNESGPEFIYAFTVDREVRLGANIDSPEPSGTDIDIHLLSAIRPPVLIDRDNLGLYAVLAPGKYFLSLDTYVNSSGTQLRGPYTLRVSARAKDTGASQYFNDYVLAAVDYLYANYRLLGYADKVLTHDIQYGPYGIIPMTGGGKCMCVSAAMETILTAMHLYAEGTDDQTVWDFLPKRSWEYLAATDIKAHIWVNSDLDSYGTADALSHFGMGENVPFEELMPGSFINVNRTTGTGHAVVFLSFIDETGAEYTTWNANVIGFRYFSSQGGADPGDGGLDYRYAIFATDEYEANGYPPMPGKRDTHIIKSDNQHILNTGMMFHPENWLPVGPRAIAKLPGGHTDFGPQVSFFDPVFFDGVTADDGR